MTYTMGDHRRAIRELAIANGWTLAPPVWSDSEIWERRESNLTLIWTERDTLTHASINIQGSTGRIPARPRMALVQAREWLSAPGESESDRISERARILNTGRTGTVVRGESTFNVRNVQVQWDDDQDGLRTWHRAIDTRTDVTIVLPEGESDR